MDKVIFLDRDGVINKCAPPHEYITSWDKFEFLPGVPLAIRILNEAKYKVVVVSNQRCIARGIATAEQVESLHEQINSDLSRFCAHINAFYYCPHEMGACNCRKPKIGLFLKAEQTFAVEKSCSYMVGDSVNDIQAGKRYGIKTIFIGKQNIGDMQCDSLFKAVEIILRGGL